MNKDSMAFRLDSPYDNERKLSQSVIQVTEILGMYHAELARILRQHCSDIGALASGRCCIQRSTESWQQGVLFIETYHQLFDYFEGDGVAMYHWMRAHNSYLNGTPHFLIVDDGELQKIHDYLCIANQNKPQSSRL